MKLQIRTVLILLFYILGISSAFGADLHWEVITSLNNAKQILSVNDTLYAATSGGFVEYSLSHRNYDSWNAENGLSNNNLTALTFSDKDMIVLATQNGVVSFFDRRNKSISEDYSLDGNDIYAMTAIQDTLWLVGKNMVAVYLYDQNLKRFQFRDFYTNFKREFGTFRDIHYFDHKIWVASDNGIFYAPGNFLRYNLKAIESWKFLTTTEGLPSNNTFSFSQKEDTLLIGTANGLAKYHSQQFTNIYSGLVGRDVRHVVVHDGQIYVNNYHSIYRLDNTTFASLANFQSYTMNDFTVTGSGDVWGAIVEKGLQNFSDNSRIWFNGPVDNILGKMTLNSRGELWVTTGIFGDQRQKGFSVRTTDGTWHNYRYFGNWRNMANSQAVMEDTEGNMWIGSWNGGLTIIDPDFKFYHFNNFRGNGKIWVASPFENDTVTFTPADSVYHFLSNTKGVDSLLVVTDLMMDRDRESIWVLTLAVQSNEPVIRYQGTALSDAAYDSLTWQKYPLGDNLNISNTDMANLGMDIFSNIWIGTQRNGALRMQIGETSGITWDNVDENDNLKNNSCLAVAGDEDGYMWLGTLAGLNAYFNGNLYDFREDYQPIGLQITDIFVDSENNKWFATDKGLSLLRASGSPWDPKSWVHFVSGNSESYGDNVNHTNLPSEDVRSVFVDDKTGDVYCGTSSGLAILRNNPYTTPLPDLEKVKVGPNPFYLGNTADNYLYIRNLTSNSQIKILTVNGRLVRTLDSSNSSEVLGSFAQWNGRNQNGRLVSSGVYLYMVTDENGNSTTGKFLVIRE